MSLFISQLIFSSGGGYLFTSLRDLIEKIVTPDVRYKGENCNQVEIFVSTLISDL